MVELFTSENVSFEQVLQQKGNGKRAVVVIISHKINRVQLSAIQDKLNQEKILNYLIVSKYWGLIK